MLHTRIIFSIRFTQVFENVVKRIRQVYIINLTQNEHTENLIFSIYVTTTITFFGIMQLKNYHRKHQNNENP